MLLRSAACFLLTSTIPLNAQQLCEAEPSDIATHVSGTWMSEVVASRVFVNGIKETGPSGSIEQVAFQFSEDGTGFLTIKDQALIATIQEPGGISMLTKPDHLSAFAAASKEASPTEKAPHKDCDIRSIPQISAVKRDAATQEGVENEVELMLIGPDLMAGAQVVTIQIDGVDTKIVSALLLRRQEGANQ